MFNNHIGINITETKLQLVEISYKVNSFYLENVDQMVHRESISESQVESRLAPVLQESFNKVVKKKPLNSQNVSFTLPNNFFRIFEIPYEETLVKKDLHAHFRWELSVLYPESDADNFLIQHIEVDKSGRRREKSAIVFAINKIIVNTINNFCTLNKLQLKYIDNVHLASNAFLYLDNPEGKNELLLSLYIDQRFSSISAIDGMYPFFFKVLDSGPNNILDELAQTIEGLKKFNLSAADFDKVLLFGQDLTSEFESRLESFFGGPLKKINPFEKLKTDDLMRSNPLFRSKYNSFAAAAGIAIRII
jgi:Tfp pilus assembly PilM family ATPase